MDERFCVRATGASARACSPANSSRSIQAEPRRRQPPSIRQLADTHVSCRGSVRWTCRSIPTCEPHAPTTTSGVDREVGSQLAVAVAYVRKDGANFIGWTDVGGQYVATSTVLKDGRTVPV